MEISEGGEEATSKYIHHTASIMLLVIVEANVGFRSSDSRHPTPVIDLEITNGYVSFLLMGGEDECFVHYHPKCRRAIARPLVSKLVATLLIGSSDYPEDEYRGEAIPSPNDSTIETKHLFLSTCSLNY